MLLAHHLAQPPAWLLAHPEHDLSPAILNQLEEDLRRLEKGEPLPYVLGWWEFYGRRFQVTPDVLIPRPETELLVETALSWLAAHPGARLAADIGTGSGCIAVSLAAFHPDLTMLASDISSQALQVARQNAQTLTPASRLHFIQADLLAYTDARFDLILSNPPYISRASLRRLRAAKTEPRLALDGGRDGLEAIRKLLAQASSRLNQPGLLLVEHEYRQGAVVQAAAREIFPQARVSTLPDLAGHARLLRIELGDEKEAKV